MFCPYLNSKRVPDQYQLSTSNFHLINYCHTLKCISSTSSSLRETVHLTRNIDVKIDTSPRKFGYLD